MTGSAALSKRVLDEYAAVRDSLPAGVVSPERRREAIEALAARGLPTTREENWRYANLGHWSGRGLRRSRQHRRPRPLLWLGARHRLRQHLPRPTCPPGWLASPDIRSWTGLLRRSCPLRRSRRTVAVRSLRRGDARDPLDTRAPRRSSNCRAPCPRLSNLPEARAALLNEAFATDTAAIHVSTAAGGPARVELVFVAAAAADAGSSYPRVRVSLDPASSLILVERHIGAAGGNSFINSSVSVDIGRGAQLTHYRLQQSGMRATWLDTLSAVLAADARYRLLAVSAGGLATRSTTHVQMAGPGAELVLSVAALGDRQQVQDNFALVEHIAPRARTEQTFRGIASGRARVAFNGKIVVREGAAGTDSRQSLRGLLAGPEAEIDVRPQLEIYTDDVRCSHGATAGKLDQDMLFYLLSRGLSPEVAQRLLKWAFLEDVVSKIELPELRRQIERDLADQMADAASLKELL